MIITCPSCDTQFRLDAVLLGSNGHKVRCSACQHIWFKEADVLPVEDVDLESPEEENSDDKIAELATALYEEEIPEGIKPGKSPKASKSQAATEPKRVLTAKAMIMSGLAASILYVVLLSPVLLMQPSIVAAWPASYGLYSLLGQASSVPGEGLIFDHLNAKLVQEEAEQYRLDVSGSLINLKSYGQSAPSLLLSLNHGEGEVLYSAIVDSHIGEIEKESSKEFHVVHAFTASDPHVQFKDSDLQIGFTLESPKEVELDALAETADHNAHEKHDTAPVHHTEKTHAAEPEHHPDEHHEMTEKHSNTSSHDDHVSAEEKGHASLLDHHEDSHAESHDDNTHH